MFSQKKSWYKVSVIVETCKSGTLEYLSRPYKGWVDPFLQYRRKSASNRYVSFISCIGHENQEEYRIMNHVAEELTRGCCRFPKRSKLSEGGGGVFCSAPSESGKLPVVNNMAVFCLDVNFPYDYVNGFASLFQFVWTVSSVVIIIVDSRSYDKLLTSMQRLGTSRKSTATALVYFRDPSQYKEKGADFLNLVEAIFQEWQVYQSNLIDMTGMASELTKLCHPVQFRDQNGHLENIHVLLREVMDEINSRKNVSWAPDSVRTGPSKPTPTDLPPISSNETKRDGQTHHGSVRKDAERKDRSAENPPLTNVKGHGDESERKRFPADFMTRANGGSTRSKSGSGVKGRPGVNVDAPYENLRSGGQKAWSRSEQSSSSSSSFSYKDVDKTQSLSNLMSHGTHGPAKPVRKVESSLLAPEASVRKNRPAKTDKSREPRLVRRDKDSGRGNESSFRQSYPASAANTTRDADSVRGHYNVRLKNYNNSRQVYDKIHNLKEEFRGEVQQTAVEETAAAAPEQLKKSNTFKESKINDEQQSTKASEVPPAVTPATPLPPAHDVLDLLGLAFSRIERDIYRALVTSPAADSLKNASYSVDEILKLPPYLLQRLDFEPYESKSRLLKLINLFQKDVITIQLAADEVHNLWTTALQDNGSDISEQEAIAWMDDIRSYVSTISLSCDMEKEALRHILNFAVELELKEFMHQFESLQAKVEHKLDGAKVKETENQVSVSIDKISELVQLRYEHDMTQALSTTICESEEELMSLHRECLEAALQLLKDTHSQVPHQLFEDTERLLQTVFFSFKKSNQDNLDRLRIQKAFVINTVGTAITTAVKAIGVTDADLLLATSAQVLSATSRFTNPDIVAYCSNEVQTTANELITNLLGNQPSGKSLRASTQEDTNGTMVTLPLSLIQRLSQEAKRSANSATSLQLKLNHVEADLKKHKELHQQVSTLSPPPPPSAQQVNQAVQTNTNRVSVDVRDYALSQYDCHMTRALASGTVTSEELEHRHRKAVSSVFDAVAKTGGTLSTEWQHEVERRLNSAFYKYEQISNDNNDLLNQEKRFVLNITRQAVLVAAQTFGVTNADLLKAIALQAFATSAKARERKSAFVEEVGLEALQVIKEVVGRMPRNMSFDLSSVDQREGVLLPIQFVHRVGDELRILRSLAANTGMTAGSADSSADESES